MDLTEPDSGSDLQSVRLKATQDADGEGDLDEFFAKDCLINQSRLLGKTYLFCLKEQPDTIVTAFSLSIGFPSYAGERKKFTFSSNASRRKNAPTLLNPTIPFLSIKMVVGTFFI